LGVNWAPMAKGGLTFVNPPYGRALATWAAKFARDGEVTELMTLTPARTDTRWFQDHMTKAAFRCFLRGRLKFHQHQPDGSWAPGQSCPFPCMVSYWGQREARFVKIFDRHGWIA
jgi:hypothetical protein